jgi:hypothetical protein
MKVGLFITNQQTLDTDMVSALDDQFAMVRLARDCGWNSLFSGQHYLNEGNNSLSILASAEPHPERKSALNRAKVSTNGVVTSQTDRAEHRLFGGSSSRHSLRRASGGHRARKPHAKHRSWQRVSWQPWAINRNL